MNRIKGEAEFKIKKVSLDILDVPLGGYDEFVTVRIVVDIGNDRFAKLEKIKLKKEYIDTLKRKDRQIDDLLNKLSKIEDVINDE